MNSEDTANFWRLDFLADVCSTVMTGQLTPVRDLLDDQKLSLRVFKHPTRIIKAKVSPLTRTKKRSFLPFIQYTTPPFVKAKRKRASLGN